jgi:hypothetical protein
VNLDDELRRLFADDRLDLPPRPDAEQAIVAGARRVRRRRFAVATASAAAVGVALVGATVAIAGAGGPRSLPAASSETADLPPESSTTPPPPPTENPAPVTPTRQATAGANTITRKPPTTSRPSTRATRPQTRGTIGPSGYAGLRLGMTTAQAEATGLMVPNAEPEPAPGCTGYDYKGSPNPAGDYSVVVSDTDGVVLIAGRADAVTPEGLAVGAPEAEMKRLYPTQAGSHGTAGEWVTAVPQNPNARYWIIVRNAVVAEIRIELAAQSCYP